MESLWDLLGMLGALIALGAFLSWLGRTWFTLVISYFVVGVVGAIVLYPGIETYRLASGLNFIADQLNSQLLRFILELADLEFAAIALSVLNKDDRQLLIFIATVVTMIAITLPFVTFANAVYAAMAAAETNIAIKAMHTEILSRLASSMDENRRAADEAQGDLRQLKKSIGSFLEAPPSSATGR